MSTKLNAGEYGRNDLFSILPEFIEVDHALNGRAERASDEQIAALAASIAEHGQQQPVLVRRIADNKVQLVAGYTRHAAVALLNQTAEKKYRLQCKVVDCNPEEAFVRNLVENIDRASTTPIDDMHNQRRLREQHGWDDAKIAAFYKKSVSHVASLRKVASLPKAIQNGVANGDVPLTAALDLAALPEKRQKEALEEATDEQGHVSPAVVRQAVREHRQEAGGRSKARTLKEVKEFLAFVSEDHANDGVRELASKLIAFIGGTITDQEMTEALGTCGAVVRT